MFNVQDIVIGLKGGIHHIIWWVDNFCLYLPSRLLLTPTILLQPHLILINAAGVSILFLHLVLCPTKKYYCHLILTLGGNGPQEVMRSGCPSYTYTWCLCPTKKYYCHLILTLGVNGPQEVMMSGCPSYTYTWCLCPTKKYYCHLILTLGVNGPQEVMMSGCPSYTHTWYLSHKK